MLEHPVSYQLEANGLKVNVVISQLPNEAVPHYDISILNISRATEIILSKIRDEFVSRVKIAGQELGEAETADTIKRKFSNEILVLLKKYLPKVNEQTGSVLVNYLITQNIGLGNIELLLKDSQLEEIVVNNHTEPIWVYHRTYGWLRTNVTLPSESRIRHYATMIGRDVGKEITLLRPLMDAHLKSGDRVNATLSPISTIGNTITIRKFAEKPWSVTDFIKSNTISYDAAAFVWLGIQNELSLLIAGGTGSGKTSALNAISNFFPPNQRLISIEDTRELILPNTLHWVPMETRMPNPEGKGEVTMLDLVVNSLRMRPDRILVGEIRKRQEAEVLFEAMHTGHSVYATLHANNVQETVTRLTNPPINLPKALLEAVSLVLVQYRNRRTGQRRTLQLAELDENGDPHVLMQLDVARDKLNTVSQPRRTLETLELYTGMNPAEIQKDIEQKVRILKYFVKNDITDVHKIGLLVARYY